MIEILTRIEAKLDRLLAAESCPLCGHPWRKHDPEDGKCDVHSDEPGMVGPCRCGRSSEFHRARNAELSRAALDA